MVACESAGSENAQCPSCPLPGNSIIPSLFLALDLAVRSVIFDLKALNCSARMCAARYTATHVSGEVSIVSTTRGEGAHLKV